MNRKMIAGIVAGWVGLAAPAWAAGHSATVTLDGDWYLQAGQVVNHSAPGILVTGLVYAMGAQEDGVAVWEDYLSDGRREDRLPGSSTHYSSQVWTGLQLEHHATWTFDGLDLDRIVHAATGEVDSQNLDYGGTSLRHAYVEVHFSDGFSGRAWLEQTGWDVGQVLVIGDAVPAVPEPASALMLMAGLGLVAGVRYRTGRTA
ncbi:PEP-CTERM sorting domain-containing protein [Sphaerotilus sp.]|uniref:PEP-CTERM sorting domain-containing protein n=1 Tax=Sphaerotilus sp. TaxID=2093942 RepID=UPI002ACE0B59|nr:PEP-CTERM sorting domain-containing protein [Sphaerotilus sp.]MDZ7855706.1 PEP-CTERM sorting domain-containing protein [Sphaerotilus sp.]